MTNDNLSPLARIAAVTSQFEALEKASAPQRAEDAEKRAAAARSGALGNEWRAVQQRIDMKQTTLGDVFSGADESPEARALLANSKRNLSEFGDKLASDDEEDSAGLDEQVAELRGLSDAFTARLAALRNLGGDR